MDSSPHRPTVSPAKNSLVYCISIAYIDHPAWRGHREEAKRGAPCGHRFTRSEGALVPLLFPGAPTGWSSIAAWCGSGATPAGAAVAPGLHAAARTRRAARAVQGDVVASITASATFGHSASPNNVTCWHIMALQ